MHRNSFIHLFIFDLYSQVRTNQCNKITEDKAIVINASQSEITINDQFHKFYALLKENIKSVIKTAAIQRINDKPNLINFC